VSSSAGPMLRSEMPSGSTSHIIMAHTRHSRHRCNDGSAYAEDAARAEAGRGGRAGVWSSAPVRMCRRARNAVYAWICKPILAAGQGPRREALPTRADGLRRPASGAGAIEDRLPGDRRAGGSRKSAGNRPSAGARQHPRWRKSVRGCPRSALAKQHSGRRYTPIGDVTPSPARHRGASQNWMLERPPCPTMWRGRNMGATCRSEPPPTSGRTSANTATLDGSYRSLRLR
jgi:hypothetical protein